MNVIMTFSADVNKGWLMSSNEAMLCQLPSFFTVSAFSKHFVNNTFEYSKVLILSREITLKAFLLSKTCLFSLVKSN